MPGDPHERDADSKQRDQIGLEAQVITAANVRANRDRRTAGPTATVAALIRAPAETGGREGDGDDLDAVDPNALLRARDFTLALLREIDSSLPG